MAEDILKCGFEFPRKVYVLGSGPKGNEHIGRINKGYFVIAVNQAIDIEGVHKSIWLCADRTLPDKQWFRNAADELIKSNHPLDDVESPTPVFDSGYLLEQYPDVPYTFDHGRSITKPPYRPEPGVLRGGGTIACQAVQLAYWLGARRIILCGVDMMGDRYFDGGHTDNLQTKFGKTWQATKWFNLVIYNLDRMGCKVSSLSETKLKVPIK